MQQGVDIRDALIGGRYRLLRLLGEGGMGSVYEVLDQGTAQRLALKLLRGQHKRRTTESELFEREYQTLASLRHPRIVQVFEYGVDDVGPFYTMELLEGGDLSRRAPMAWRDVCMCLRDAASILGVLHARRLLHRDLNPRNLWLTPDGRLKLLDFGALTAFGPAREIAGTPPFVPPEALHGAPLDQRSDLFALGALGYWLLTSTHAFRATQLGELPALWRNAPAPASALAKLVHADGAALPVELDRLVASLLRLTPDERPRNTADVVDHLNAIAGLRAEPEHVVIEGYLERSAFVGRAHERKQFAAQLLEAQHGAPTALLIEGEPGSGRTRLLDEYALVARIDGAAVISVTASVATKPYECATALVRGLLQRLPSAATLSDELTALLTPTATPPSAARDVVTTRLRKQSALADFILTLARQRTLVLLVDDVHLADEQSQALLALLARADAGHRLLLVCSVTTAATPVELASLHGLRTRALRLRLGPLTPAETRELLRSVFGEVPYLERLTARLHEHAHGSPSGVSMLARHLVRVGDVRYADGTWILPHEASAELPSTLHAGVSEALIGLPEPARRAARLTSLSEHGPLPRPLLCALAEVTEHDLTLLLERRVLRESAAGLQLAHRTLGGALRAELSAEEQRRAHPRLAHWLGAEPDLVSQVRAGLHHLHAQQFERGEAQLLAASRRILAGDHEHLRVAAPIFADALTLLQRAGRDAYAQVPTLSVLSVAAYMVARSYAAQYGDATVRALECVLSFDWAKRVRPYLGAWPALLVALLASAFNVRVRRTGLRTLELVRWLVAVLGYLMGPAAMCLDGAKLRHYASVLEPLSVLGKQHGVSLVQRFCLGLAATSQDQFAAARRLQRPVIARLQRPEPVSGLTAINRRNLLGALLYADGIRDSLACDEHVLVTSSLLERFSPMHAMQAEHLRALYFAHRGELERAATHEAQVELRAIQLGTAWQAELLVPRHQMRLARWTLDVGTNKRAAQTLAALASELPSFALCERGARAAGLVLRGKHAEAWSLLVSMETNTQTAGWVFLGELRAVIHNTRGEHAQAKQVCVDTLNRLTEEDRWFVMMTLALEAELAIAEAGLGAYDVAQASFAALQKAHAGKGPLIEGYLQRAGAQAAFLARDLEAAEHHVMAMEHWYRQTRVPSLFIACAEFRDRLKRLRQPAPDVMSALASQDDGHLHTRLELLMTSTHGELEERMRAALQLTLDLSGADRGFIVRADGSTLTVGLGFELDQEVVAWALGRLQAAREDDGHTAALSTPPSITDLTVRVIHGVRHRLCTLWRVQEHVDQCVAALVLGSEDAAPELPPVSVLRMIADHVA